MFSAVITTTDICRVDGERVRRRQPNTIKPIGAGLPGEVTAEWSQVMAPAAAFAPSDRKLPVR